MLRIEMPDGSRVLLETLLLDINGTITTDGELMPGVASRLDRLRGDLSIRLVTRDTLGLGGSIAKQLGVGVDVVPDGEKMRVIEALGPETAVMIGNGASDVDALQRCAVGIAVIGPEGCAAEALAAADVVVTNPADALDILLAPTRLVSTLRR
jgi:P-type E1-E2 ATPase